MQQEELWIRNGTIITAHGSMDADLWIAGGKIRRVARDTLDKFSLNRSYENRLTVIDASGMYLLPGFIALTQMPLTRIRGVQEYVNEVHRLIRHGFTCMLDTLHVEEWMGDSQVEYQKALHFNSLIDYSIRIALDAAHLRPEKIRALCQQDYRLFQVVASSCQDLYKLPWDDLISLHDTYKFSVHLYIPPNAHLSEGEREEAIQYWIEKCRYAKIRTSMSGQDPYALTEREPFYHVTQVEGEKAGRVLEYLSRYRHQSLAAAASLNDIVVDLRRKKWEAEELFSLLVRLSSTNIAKLLGLYPTKGSLTPGADADILFLKKEELLTKIDLSTILNLSEFHLPASVMANGRWIYHEKQYAPTIGMGRCLVDAKPYNYVI